MKKASAWQRFRYWFDNLMSKGTASLLLLLAVITTIAVVIGGLIAIALGGPDGTGVDSPGYSIWFTLMHTISTGVLTKEEGTFAYLAVMAIVTLVGMFITSFLIGTISNGIKDKVTDLQRGKSLVIEEGHTVVIGFGENITNIIEELVLANENQSHAVVVVMSEQDKVEMEATINDRIPDPGNLRIVCRNGKPDSLSDLKICSLDTCRSIIVNLDDDFMTVKTILACESLLDEAGNKEAYITATIRDPEVLHPAQIAGGERAEILNFHKTIGRLMVQSGRHPGMSAILSELLSFEGHEIYVGTFPEAAGLTVNDISLRLPHATAIGLVRNDHAPADDEAVSDEAKLIFAPDAVLESSDQLIWIADDDHPLQLEAPASVNESVFGQEDKTKDAPRNLLVIGCSDMIGQILLEADEFAAPGSKVIIAVEPDRLDADTLPAAEELSNVEVDLRECSIFQRHVLEELVTENPSSIMLLADTGLEAEDADARTLMLQLQLTDIEEEIGSNVPLIIEMNNPRNQKLSQRMRATDFVLSSDITAKMMVQISEHRDKKAILNDLISDDGSAIYLKSITRYAAADKPVDFHTLGSSAARFGEIAIGYKKFVDDGTFTVAINPLGGEQNTFHERDELIVIAAE
ncbi:MAG: hypothetical protein IKD85_06285 [Firmicutes bacterium]|nr:hypothetical protein [Bacillota bacterium]